MHGKVAIISAIKSLKNRLQRLNIHVRLKYITLSKESKMTTITLHTSKLLIEVTKLLTEAKDALAERAKVKRTIRELNSLTDRELADMGIHRGDITSVAKGEIKRSAEWTR